MSCLRLLSEAEIDGESIREKTVRDGLCRGVALAEELLRLGQNRAAAALFLQAAAMAEGGAAREHYRRRGAQLISSRTPDHGRSLAC
jgi:hypothetical protein